MERYSNQTEDSDIAGFAVGEGFIDIWFIDGGIKRYSEEIAGAQNVKHMTSLARAGRGLQEFVSRYISYAYDR